MIVIGWDRGTPGDRRIALKARFRVGSSWVLAIDFGTSNTAAAHVNDLTGRVEAVPLTHTSELMTSSVYVGGQGHVTVGDVALNQSVVDPSGLVREPKRMLSAGQSAFQVRDSEISADVALAGVYRVVLDRAVPHHQGNIPSGLILTHPEGWSPSQVGVVRRAAERLGFPAHRIRTVSEPVAAACYYAQVDAVRAGERVAVFDFGAGTLDVAVLECDPAGVFQVVAAHGDNALGGRNLDAAIRRWVEDELGERDQGLLASLRQDATLRDRWALDDSIRKAKELLSESATASIDIHCSGRRATVLLNREQLETLIDKEIERAAALTESVLRSSGGTAVTAIYLTGGSSRIPLVHRRLQSLGRIATLDDPKLVVAKGAHVAAVEVPVVSPSGSSLPHTAAPAPVLWADRTTSQVSPASRDRRRKLLWAAALVAMTFAAGGGFVAYRYVTRPPAPIKATSLNDVLAAIPPALEGIKNGCREVDEGSRTVTVECGVDLKAPFLAGLTIGDPGRQARLRFEVNSTTAKYLGSLWKTEPTVYWTGRPDKSVVVMVRKPTDGTRVSDTGSANPDTGLICETHDIAFKDVPSALEFLQRSGLL
ncbi:MAG: Hsp70 family protein [Mycobacteriaceae bacterium]|nr:Hsp70 family protein [Mycobacteriaceae bacterium]